MQPNLIISAALNLLSFLMTCMGIVVLMNNKDNDKLLEGNGLSALKFFTVQSNLLYGFYAGVFAVCELVYGSSDAVPEILYVLKYVFTVGVTLTILTVILYLAPVVEGSYPPLFRGANLYFHLLIPVLAIISFSFFERGSHISLPQVFLGMIPFSFYLVYYAVNSLSHAENGQVPEKYDWYRFLSGGTKKAVIPIVVMIAAVTVICFGLWLINLI